MSWAYLNILKQNFLLRVEQWAQIDALTPPTSNGRGHRDYQWAQMVALTPPTSNGRGLQPVMSAVIDTINGLRWLPLHLQPVMGTVTDTNNELRSLPLHLQPVMGAVTDTNNELRWLPLSLRVPINMGDMGWRSYSENDFCYTPQIRCITFIPSSVHMMLKHNTFYMYLCIFPLPWKRIILCSVT